MKIIAKKFISSVQFLFIFSNISIVTSAAIGSELEATRQVFFKNNVSLNCLGVPTKIFSKYVDSKLTDTTNAEDVRFFFSSRESPQYKILEAKDEFSLEGIDFDITRETILITHGFLSSGEVEWLTEMKKALLQYKDVNVIIVDWHKGSNTRNYVVASISTKIVGQQISKLFAQIRQLAYDGYFGAENQDGTTWGTLHFIGHSLGSHICGYASYAISESQKEKANPWIVTRITGLDPAQPCFVTADPRLKLDRDDALFVDVIHTNARLLIYLGLGLPQQLGYVDFYPNGGQIQVGCAEVDLSLWEFITEPKAVLGASLCSHGRAYEYFTASILNKVKDNCTFVGRRWNHTSFNVDNILNSSCEEDVCPEMGISSIDSFPNNKGVFFVPTGDEAPFCELNSDHKKIISRQLKDDQALENSFMTRFLKRIHG